MRSMFFLGLLTSIFSFSSLAVENPTRSLQRGTISNLNLENQTIKIEGHHYLLGSHVEIANQESHPSNLRGLKTGQLIEYNVSTDPKNGTYPQDVNDLKIIDYIKVISKPQSSDKGE